MRFLKVSPSTFIIEWLLSPYNKFTMIKRSRNHPKHLKLSHWISSDPLHSTITKAMQLHKYPLILHSIPIAF